jgi:mRNA interferase MazF
LAGRLNRGDVHLCRLAPPDKQRLVVILTRNSAIGHLSTATVAPISSTVRDVPSEVVLGVDDGMKGRCAVNLHHAVTVSQERLGRRVASLSNERMQQVCIALRFSLGCGSAGSALSHMKGEIRPHCGPLPTGQHLILRIHRSSARPARRQRRPTDLHRADRRDFQRMGTDTRRMARQIAASRPADVGGKRSTDRDRVLSSAGSMTRSSVVEAPSVTRWNWSYKPGSRQ